MGANGQLTDALRITNVNDFLTPSATCVLPLGGGATPASPSPAPAGSVLAPIIPSREPEAGGPKATITVSDCLACSGCVTSAETVLLSSASVDAFRAFIARPPEQRFAVVGLGQQSVAALAAHFGLRLAQTARRIATFLHREAQVDAVVDVAFPRHLALLEASAEFLERIRAGKTLTITSDCPGWVTYAEKTQDAKVLDSISSVRSPQAILGAIAGRLRPSGDTRPVWLASVAQCHEKKLEASRPEFVASRDVGGSRPEVDCVLTTGELLELMDEKGFDIREADETDLDDVFKASPLAGFGVASGSTSGGYADFVLRVAAKEVLGVSLPDGQLITDKSSRSGDMKTATVSNKSGSLELRFATVYGFRALQSVLRKIRRGECVYNYIELMACPGGCNNGGGQLPMPPVSDSDSRSLKLLEHEHLERVNEAFTDAPCVEDPFGLSNVKSVYQEVIGGGPGSKNARKKLSMSIQSRKSTGVSSLEW